MPATSTVDEFLQTIQRSGLVDRARLTDYLQRLGRDLPPPDQPASLAACMVRDAVLTGYQVKQLLAGKWQRFTLLGKYKILDVIGVGGMGRVYLCEHVLLRRLVAVKVLPIAKTSNPLAVERFYREARAVAALNHPNIVRCFDVDQDGMLHFMVMEFIDGANFETLVRLNQKLDVTRTANYIRQAALGLQHAHEAGWVHRDIKPANLLLDRSGTVKLLDLGLARLFADPGDNLTKVHDEGAVLGTADYIAPEQAVASHEVDIRADIYSLGCTIYFCLTGRPPFCEGTMAQKLIWHQMRQPEPLRQLRLDVPVELAAVVEKMLAKDATQRYQTPIEVAHALAPWSGDRLPPPPAQEMPQLEPLVLSLSQSDPASSGTVARGTMPSLSGSSVMRRIMEAPSSSGLSASGDLPSISPTSGIGLSNTPPSAPTIAFAEGRSATPPSRPASSISRPPSRKLPVPDIKNPPPSATPKTQLRRWLVPVLIGVVLLAAGGVGAKFFLGQATGPVAQNSGPATTQPASPPAPAGPPALQVTRNPRRLEEPNTFRSVREALERARAGDRIVILDQSYEERLSVDGQKLSLPRPLTIESGSPDGKRTVWQLPADVTDNVPMVKLHNVEELRIKGITFDGEHRTDNLIALSGPCRGLKLEDVHLRGFNAAGMQLTDCSGTADAPITFQGLRLTTRTKGGSPAAVVLGAGTNRHLLFNECRFEGPYESVIRLEGTAAALEFRRNRFYRATAAFRVKKGKVASALRMVIDSNTFYDLQTALHLEDVPMSTARPESQIVLRNNLFARTAALAALDEATASEKARALLENCEGNIRDGDSATGGVDWVPTTLKTFQLPTDPEQDGRFLRYPRTSALMTAGAGGRPVGVPPAE